MRPERRFKRRNGTGRDPKAAPKNSNPRPRRTLAYCGQKMVLTMGSTLILILADTGGSNGAQRGAWKQQIQRQLCDGLGLFVTVSHYPSGASKWNPIEHRLFSQISRNWAAE